MKRAPKVILIDLPLVQRPAMMLVLADVKPLLATRGRNRSAFCQAWTEAVVHPIAWHAPHFRRALTHAGDERHDAMLVQQHLEIFNFALIDGTLGQDDDVDAVHLLSRGHNHPTEKVEIKLVKRREFKQ